MHESELLLGNEAFIDRIVREDGGFAEKIVSQVLSLDKAFAKLGDKKAARKTAKEARGVEREALSLFLLKDIENYTKCKFCIIKGSKIAIFWLICV